MSTAATALAASSMSTTEPQLENRVLTPFTPKGFLTYALSKPGTQGQTQKNGAHRGLGRESRDCAGSRVQRPGSMPQNVAKETNRFGCGYSGLSGSAYRSRCA
jgi:hypothetical protein